MKNQLLAFGLVAAAGIASAVAQGVVGANDDAATTAQPAFGTPMPVVQTTILTAAPDRLSRQFFGQVRARETVDLAFEVGGTLRRLIPEEGMRVVAGETIAQLRLDPLERAVARAELQLEMATREAERAAQLAARAVGPEIRAEDAANARDLAEVALRDARAALAVATLTAPFDGVVAQRIAAAHGIVAPGQPVLRLHDMSEVRVEIAVPERLLANFGGLDDVHFSAHAEPDWVAPLRLVAVRPETDRVGQSFRVTLAFEGSGGAGLLPGASVSVRAEVLVPGGGGGMTVPAAALLARNNRQAEVVVLEDRAEGPVARRMPVQVTAPGGDAFRIDGLPEGAEVVVMGAHRLVDGQAVRRFAPLTQPEN